MRQDHWGWRCWRVLYPVLIHWGILNLVSIGGMMVLTLQMRVGTDLQGMEALMQAYVKNSTLYTGIASLLTLPVALFFYQRDKRFLAPVRRKISPLWYAAAFIIGACACFGLNGLLNITGMTAVYQKDLENLNQLIYSSPLLLQLAVTGLVVPVAEELIFRGLVFKRMRTYLHFWPAALISALIFGIYHGNMLQLIYAGMLGLGMAFLYEQFRNILAPILFHAAANILSVVISNSEEINQFFSGTNGMIYYMALTVICLAAAISLLWMMQMKMKPGEGKTLETVDGDNSLL